jgi:hypothetical protein
MRRLARGYSIHLRSRAALIRRNDRRSNSTRRTVSADLINLYLQFELGTDAELDAIFRLVQASFSGLWALRALFTQFLPTGPLTSRLLQIAVRQQQGHRHRSPLRPLCEVCVGPRR